MPVIEIKMLNMQYTDIGHIVNGSFETNRKSSVDFGRYFP